LRPKEGGNLSSIRRRREEIAPTLKEKKQGFLSSEGREKARTVLFLYAGEGRLKEGLLSFRAGRRKRGKKR